MNERKNLGMLFLKWICGTGLFFALLSPVMASAASISPASDTLSRIQSSVTANHELRFKTPSGVNAPTDTITIDFPGFSLGSLSVGDVDLFQGAITGFETGQTIAALPAVGVWGVTIVGTTVTFTAPTDAAPGTVPAGNYIGIRLGTNAVGGSNQITNPSTAQSAQVAIAGAFGDAGTVGVVIIDNDGVAVTATVDTATTTTSTSSGGGCIGCGGPVPPPLISNVQAINITQTGARITWITDSMTNSTVDYGFTISYASGTVSNPTYVISGHQIDISSLTPNTTYHFRVTSVTPGAVSATAGDFTFTTTGDVLPPVISNVQVVNITDTSALVIWSTDEPASSLVNYGTTTAYGSISSAVGFVTSHAIQLNGLTPSTLYHFDVLSIDGVGNASVSVDGTFTTLADITPPTNITNLVVTPGDTQNQLAWTNPPDVDFSGVRIVRKTSGFPTSFSDGTIIFVGSGTTFLNLGLVNGQTYYYGVYAFDTANNFASGALGQGTPNGPVSPPAATSTPPVVPPSPIISPPPGVLQPPPPGSVTPAPTIPATIGTIPVYFYGNNGSILLDTDALGNVGILVDSPVVARVPVIGLSRVPATMTMDVGGALYAMRLTPDGTAYLGTFFVDRIGVAAFQATAVLSDGSILTASRTLQVQGAGKIVNESVTGPTDEGVAQASVQLYRFDQGAWRPYGSPIPSASDGSYAFVVENGSYYAEVSKDGYLTLTSAPSGISRNVYNLRYSLIAVPVPQPTITATAAVQAVFAIEVARNFLQQPVIQQAAQTSQSGLLAITVANLALATPFFNLLAYLQFLFFQPILVFNRGKKRQWGVVYNSLTKMPIELAIVRLVHADSQLIVQTRVTDREGRFFFITKPGQYRLEIVKPGFIFPSQLVVGVQQDAGYASVYHGKPIEIGGDGLVAVHVPADPLVKDASHRSIIWKNVQRKAQRALASVGVIVAAGCFIVSPNWLMGGVFVLHVVTYVLFKRLNVPSKPKSWGSVLDEQGKPMEQVIVRLFDKKFNKLLETQITSRTGRYGFLVRRNAYFLVAEKVGYERFISPDIHLEDQDQALVDLPVRLKKL